MVPINILYLNIGYRITQTYESSLAKDENDFDWIILLQSCLTRLLQVYFI